MALTQSDLDRLDKAIASEELEVWVDGVRTKYRSTDELLRARQWVSDQLRAQAAPGRGTVGYFRLTGSRD